LGNWNDGIISKKISVPIEVELFENNEKWLDVDESIIGGMPRVGLWRGVELCSPAAMFQA
jgi:hypothetical protein